MRVDAASRNAFYHSGTLEILSQGKTALRLPGVPQPEAFRHTVLNAVRAWAPGKATGSRDSCRRMPNRARAQSEAMTLKVTLVQGGGIGLDQVPAMKHVLSAAGVPIEWDEYLAGWASLERGGRGAAGRIAAVGAHDRLGPQDEAPAAAGGRRRDRSEKRQATSTCSFDRN